MKHCLKTKFKNLFCNEFFIQTGKGPFVAGQATTFFADCSMIGLAGNKRKTEKEMHMSRLYLKTFNFPTLLTEEGFLEEIKQTCYTTYYPFRIVSYKELESLDFQPVTIFYGGNGSGKTTMLNIIAEKVAAARDTLFNRSSFFDDYLKMCHYKLRGKPENIRIITSDDVFDFILNILVTISITCFKTKSIRLFSLM